MEDDVSFLMNVLDEALLNLANIHRRRVLLTLLHNESQTVEELSAPEDNHAVDAEQKEIKAKMYHAHLPKLVDVGFIEWNRDNQTVAKGPRFDEIESLLKLLADNRGALPGGNLQ